MERCQVKEAKMLMPTIMAPEVLKLQEEKHYRMNRRRRRRKWEIAIAGVDRVDKQNFDESSRLERLMVLE